MNRSDSINHLAAALAKAQGEMNNAPKDGAIASGPKRYRYATLGSIWDACRPALSSNNLAVTQDAEVGGAGIKLTTVLMHASGQFVSNELLMPCASRDEKGIGQAMTYARKYALAAIVGVAPDDDEPRSTIAGGTVATAEQIAEARRISCQLDLSQHALRARCSRQYGVTELDQLRDVQAMALLAELRAELAQRTPAEQLTATHTTPPSAPPASIEPNADQSFQDALANHQQAGEAAGGNGHAQVLGPEDRLYVARDSYFSLIGLGDVADPAVKADRAKTWNKILAKRGCGPLTPPTIDVINELTATLERRVAEIVEERRLAGVTCAAKEGGAERPAPKS